MPARAPAGNLRTGFVGDLRGPRAGPASSGSRGDLDNNSASHQLEIPAHLSTKSRYNNANFSLRGGEPQSAPARVIASRVSARGDLGARGPDTRRRWGSFAPCGDPQIFSPLRRASASCGARARVEVSRRAPSRRSIAPWIDAGCDGGPSARASRQLASRRALAPSSSTLLLLPSSGGLSRRQAQSSRGRPRGACRAPSSLVRAPRSSRGARVCSGRRAQQPAPRRDRGAPLGVELGCHPLRPEDGGLGRPRRRCPRGRGPVL